eukprot:4275776-Heterocapsa_arctica.AAC.1
MATRRIRRAMSGEFGLSQWLTECVNKHKGAQTIGTDNVQQRVTANQYNVQVRERNACNCKDT